MNIDIYELYKVIDIWMIIVATRLPISDLRFDIDSVSGK